MQEKKKKPGRTTGLLLTGDWLSLQPVAIETEIPLAGRTQQPVAMGTAETGVPLGTGNHGQRCNYCRV